MKIKCDSRKIEPGDTFLALRGVNDDGHCYIEDAIKNGAQTVIVEEGLYEVETIVVKNTREYLEKYLKETYAEELSKIKLIGVTGTNGKTTTCYLLYQALNKAGIKTAYLGTIGFYLDGKRKDLNNTTPDLYDLYEMILTCVEEGVSVLAMEVSSQALSMHRVAGLEFDVAVFTNLTKEHLDYHLDMKSYALAKQQLFEQVKQDGIAYINIDDDYHSYFCLKQNKNKTYGFLESDYKIHDVFSDELKTSFSINQVSYETTLLGRHNIYNASVVAIILEQFEIEEQERQKILKELECPKGRMDTIKVGEKMAIVDYAHTPDALKNIIEAVRPICKKRLITIVGCGGNRDKTKRPEMGKLATTLSDYVIFTSDNPRYEDPLEILKDMTDKLATCNYGIEANREEAIKKGVQSLEKDDILLVLGKGHETYQVIQDKKIEFDDKEKLLKYMRS